LEKAEAHTFARHSDPSALHRAMHRSALLVIDLQRAFTDPQQPPFVRDAPAAVNQAVRLVNAFRRAASPVVFTRHAHATSPCGPGMGRWWSSFVLEGTDASLLDPAFVPLDEDLVLRKEHYSAFRETHLDPWLRERAIETVVFAGTMTHICVDTTARDAFMHGFDVVVVHDACASRPAALHTYSLHALSHAFARLAATDDVVRMLGEMA
jgi:bifunctional isochorismate lyase/aryl carrier protein